MNGDQALYENQVLSKKFNKIDEEPQTGKKGKKNRKQKQQMVDVEEQLISRDRQKPGGKMSTASKKDPQSDEKIFTQLCARLPQYKQGTILKFLQQTNFDKEEAYSRVLMTVPDNEKQPDWMKDMGSTSKYNKKAQIEESSTSSAPSQNANSIMNQVFDSLLKEEINGREFQELFEEIAEMIKQDQKEKGVGIMEINSFVDECNTVKQTLLIGFRQELSNFDDFEIDSTSPLYAQTQQFIQEIITKQVQQQKQMREDFPTLGGGSSKKKNIVEQIKSQNKKKREEEHLFTPNRSMLPTFAREKHSQTSLFNVNNQLASQKDLISLNQEYEDVPIIDLKFIYKALGCDYNLTVDFLNKQYDPKHKHKLVRQVRVIHHSLPTSNDKKQMPNIRREEEGIDKELEHLSLEQLREEIDHLYKLRQAFQITKMKIKNTSQRKQLDRICCQNDPLIRKLSRAARIKTVHWMLKNNPLYVDLHGWREDQIDQLLDSIQRMIVDQGSMSNDRIRSKVSGGRRVACLTAMTGKGLHSKGRRSVLKPAVLEWCEDNKLSYEQADDHVKIYVVLS